jgi:transcriptional regulator with XRE-family HTH domain
MREFAAEEIGARIALARKHADGMTQAELAEALDLSVRQLQNIEAGATIPWKYFSRLEEIFQKPLGWFLHGKAPVTDDRLEGLEGVVVDGFAAVNRRLERLEERLPREEPPEVQADEDVP